MDPLSRYRAVLQDERSAQYLACKSIPVVLDGKETLDDLWNLHGIKLRDMGDRSKRRVSSPHIGNNLLDLKVILAKELLRKCCFCERRCNVDRTMGERGSCGVVQPRIASHFIHHGEEGPLVPSYTVFLAGCNMYCVYCQNYDISTDPECGSWIRSEEMALRIAHLDPIRTRGDFPPRHGRIRNVNWVGGEPTPAIHYILEVLAHCQSNVPQVWNSNMYLSEEAMLLLNGTMDVYLTDLKYGNDVCAERLSGVKRYMEVVTRNHRIAMCQGEVIVRHLMLPGHFDCCTVPIVGWLSENMVGAYVNIMAQYHPEHRAREFPELRRHISAEEYARAIRYAKDKGLNLI
jgi:putative pyruvate formate lyase activating enzyme